MEEKLTAILTRIEKSNLPEEDKVKLYGLISEGLKASIWPTLLAAMPKDALETLTKLSGKSAVEAYMALIEDATKDGKALDEVEQTMYALLDEVDAALKEEKI